MCTKTICTEPSCSRQSTTTSADARSNGINLARARGSARRKDLIEANKGRPALALPDQKGMRQLGERYELECDGVENCRFRGMDGQVGRSGLAGIGCCM
jgi:hypothetical protein